MADRLGCAVLSQKLQSLLRIPGMIQGSRLARPHHRDESDGPHRLRMPGEKDLSRESAIGSTAQIHRTIAEIPPHLVDVIHGRRRGVLTEIRPLLELVAAGGDRIERKKMIEPRSVAPQRAGQGIRPTRAASIDEHDVASHPHGIVGELSSIHRRPRSRTAFEEENGIRRPVRPLRRQDDDLQRDLSPGAGLSVFKDLVRPAEGLAALLWQGAGGKLPLPGRPRRRLGGR